MPAADLRPLLERVYADDSEDFRKDIPAVLHQRHDRAAGSMVLALDDETPRTRLGDNHTVLLAVIEDGGPRFLGWDGDGDGDGEGDPLEASEFRCPCRLQMLSEQRPLKQALAARLPAAKRHRLSYRDVVFLTGAGPAGWHGDALAHSRTGEERRRGITYDPVRGLRMGSGATADCA